MPQVGPHRLRRALGATLALLLGSSAAAAAPITGNAPYPPSQLIRDVTFDWSTYRGRDSDGQGSDNWPSTVAVDGRVFTSWGDGGGAGEDANAKAYVSIGFGEITGSTALTARITNLIGGLKPTIARCFPYFQGAMPEKRSTPERKFPCSGQSIRAKSRSILALDGYLYAHLTPGSGELGYAEARLYRAPFDSNEWERARWAFKPAGRYPIIAPAFLQAGANLADQPEWVYAYAVRYGPVGGPDDLDIQSGPNGGEITLMRAARTAKLMEQASWSFFAGLGAGGVPIWNPQQDQAQGVFFDKNGVGWHLSAYYIAAWNRYLIVTANTKPRAGHFGIFESEHPWGPYATVYYGPFGNPPEAPYIASALRFLANSFTPEGKFTAQFDAGATVLDAFNLVDGTFTLATTAAPTAVGAGSAAAAPPLQTSEGKKSQPTRRARR